MKREFKVRFLPIDRSFPAEDGQNILELAMKAGIHINASCSGNGTCGRCKVKILEGDVVSEIHPKITGEEYDGGVRLACQSIVKGNLIIEIPLESQIDKSVLRRTAADVRIFHDWRSDGTIEAAHIAPLVTKHFVELPAPTVDDNVSDWGRLTRGLGGIFPGNGFVTSLDVLRGLGRKLREGQWRVTVTCAIRRDTVEIIAVEASDWSKDVYSIAIDIGTTTVCGRIIDAASSSPSGAAGRIAAEAADYNAQIAYGEDVISRIMYARKKGGLRKLQAVVAKTINGVINDLLALSKVEPHTVSHIVFAGNTTMTHLFLGIDPTYLMLSPYTPVATFFPPARAGHLGIELVESAEVYCFPCVASYVGGDIVSGVLASSMNKDEKVSLFMDVGTNGEIVLGNKEWLLSVSCSAGPAFEGGGIQFGVRATRGAIEQVKIHPSTYEPMILTIDRARPMGICGSGLIDLVAGLLEAGLIDQKGKFRSDKGSRRIRKGDGGYEYLICQAEETSINKDIVITEIDLDNLIRTKAAIFAGCKVLLDNAGLSFPELHEVIIAGGFGHYIDIEKAKTIGLLPDLPDEKFRFIGNSSLTGAQLVSLDRGLWEEAQTISKMMTNVELANNNRFMDEFVAAMFLPHTDESLYPEVTERLRSV